MLVPLQQTDAWGRFQAGFPDRELLGRIRAGGVEGLVVRQSLPAGFSYLLAQRGPVFGASATAADLEAFIARTRELGGPKALFLRIDPALTPDDPRAAALAGVGRPSYTDTVPTTTRIIDLVPTEEEILLRMHPKGRYNIKVAAKHGVTCRLASADELGRIHPLFLETAARDGFAVHPERTYARMLEALGSAAELVVAEQDDELLAANILTYDDAGATYYYGASSNRARNAMAPFALQWFSMRRAKERGMPSYDLLGVAPEDAEGHPLAGVSEFKRKFGGRIVTTAPGRDVVFSPAGYRLFLLARKLRRGV